jgi:propionyl-CoA carboxylase beta chain
VAHITSANDVECLEDSETIVELFTTTVTRKASWITNSMMRFVNNWSIPDNPNKPYDMHTVIAGIIDEDSFEVHKNYAENI